MDMQAQERSRGFEIMALLLAINCLNMLDRNLPFILAEAIKADLDLSDSQIGLLGGMVFAVADRLRIPICFVGTGEKLDDLAEFDANRFLQALLASPGADT